MPVNRMEHMWPVTAGAHICSSPGRCSQKRGEHFQKLWPAPSIPILFLIITFCGGVSALSFSLLPHLPCIWRDVEGSKNDTNWKWLRKPWKHMIKLLPLQSFLAAGFVLQPVHNAQDVCTVQGGGCRPQGNRKTPSCTKCSTAQWHAVLAVIGEE